MVSQISQSVVARGRAFDSFKQPQDGYYLNAPINNKKDENNHKIGKAITASALVVGFGTLALFGGGLNKKAGKLLDKLKIKLEQKAAKSGSFQNFYRFSLARVNSFIEKCGSINNFTTLKDVAFQRLMWGKNGNRKFTRKIHESVTRFFDRISRKTVNSSYATTHSKFASLNEYFMSINERLLREHPNDKGVADAINEIRQRVGRVNSNLEKGFGIDARNKRLTEVNKATEGLFDFFWDASFKDVKNFKSKNMWQTFIAEDYMIPTKMRLANETGAFRQAITHNVMDSYNATIKAVDNIQKFVKPSDKATNEAMGALRQSLNNYKNLSGENEIAQLNLLNTEIKNNLKNLLTCFEKNDAGYSPEAIKALSSYVAQVDEIISKNSKGELQEILSAYKRILPESEYNNLKKQVQAAIKSLDNSIDIETVQYVDKARDLKLGSAPTDVLSIVGTVGAVGYYLNKSDGKDEKISASLKYGIPAIGAIATSLYCTARLVSGGKAMGLGLVSGWIMNKIGEVVDNARKKYAVDIDLHRREFIKAQSDNV